MAQSQSQSNTRNKKKIGTESNRLAEGDDLEEQVNELIALEAIYENEDLDVCSHDNAYGDLPGGIFNIPIYPPQPFSVKMTKNLASLRKRNHVTTRGRGRGRHRPKQNPEHSPVASPQNNVESQPEPETLHAVKRLPPITLTFAFPYNYPSAVAPIFTLSCCWLDKMDLTKLCQKLDEIWQTCEGMVVVMNWVTFLQEELVYFLDLQSPYDLGGVLLHRYRHVTGESDRTVPYPQHTLKSFDSRGFHNFQSVEEVLPRVLDFNLVTCDICFEEMAGCNFLRLVNCSEHLTCKECMKGWIEARIGEGGVIDLKCPGYKCDNSLLPMEVASVVSNDLFQHYDALLLKTAFDVMSDVLHCPRSFCQFPVVLEDNLGLCQKCHHAFCARCQNTYHGHSPCKLKDEMFKAITEEYESCGPDRQRQLEMQYGKKTIKRALDETKSNQWLESNSKQCPNCSTFIQKNDGCNKMTCSNCRTFFCWLCQEELSRSNPYAHYQHPTSPCTNRLFEGLDIPEEGWENALLAGMDERDLWMEDAYEDEEDDDHDEDDDVEFRVDDI